MSNADWTTAIARCFIAIAALANVYVYYGMWKQTSDLFRESYKPRLSVAIKQCRYSNLIGRLKGRIVTTNHRDAVANGINLRIRFGYSNFIKDITRVSIQPQNKLVYTFVLPMTLDGYERGQTVGNRSNLLVEGSFKELGNVENKYSERQDCDPELRQLVPIWAE